MEYAQLNEALTEAIQVTTRGNVQWDANNFCTAEALFKDGKDTQFRVVPLTVTAPPAIDPITQSVMRDGCEKVGNDWRYKWVVESLTEQQIAANMAVLKQGFVAQIKAERDRRKFNGVFVADKWIHSDTYSRTQWMAMVMMGASIPAIVWTTMDDSTVTTSQTLANQVFQAVAQLDAVLFAHAKSLIAAVEASSTPSQIDITTGWPATYTGA